MSRTASSPGRLKRFSRWRAAWPRTILLTGAVALKGQVWLGYWATIARDCVLLFGSVWSCRALVPWVGSLLQFRWLVSGQCVSTCQHASTRIIAKQLQRLLWEWVWLDVSLGVRSWIGQWIGWLVDWLAGWFVYSLAGWLNDGRWWPGSPSAPYWCKYPKMRPCSGTTSGRGERKIVHTFEGLYFCMLVNTRTHRRRRRRKCIRIHTHRYDHIYRNTAHNTTFLRAYALEKEGALLLVVGAMLGGDVEATLASFEGWVAQNSQNVL